MTRFLVATSSVHVTAAAADYLQGRIDPDTDDVIVLAVREPDAPDRDAGDAANVARSRLAAAMPTTETRAGDSTGEILSAVDEHDPDELIVGAHRGTAGAGPGPGSTARELIERLDRPVVVVPVPRLE
ncbi:MAG: universal stress protein [Haloarculaceae archaeon]